MSDPPDVVTFIVSVIALIASTEVAHLVGPYAAIVVLACAGAALSLSGHEDNLSRWGALFYIGIRVLVAVTLTVAIAELLQNVIPWAKPRATLVPLAFGIGWIRDYGSIRSWIGEVIDRFTKGKIDGPK